MHLVKTGSSAQCTHPRNPGCARTATRSRALHCVVAHWAPYRGAWASCRGCVVAHTGCVAGRVARSATRRVVAPRSRYKNCITTQSLSRVSQRSRAVSQGAAALYRSLVAPYHDTKGRPPVTIQKLFRDPLRPGRPRARAPFAPARRSGVS